MKSNKYRKPFLKWVGGKTQIIDHVMNKFPEEIDNYHEVFLGGGSVLLALLTLQKEKKIVIRGKIYAYDINTILINVYKNVQKNKDILFNHISNYMREYENIKGDIIKRKAVNIEEAKTSKESYYYWLRSQFNKMDKTSIECSALFMVLNKLCFRGMYREGPNGFNVPYGHYKKTPTIIKQKDLTSISELIQDVEFIQSDFSESMKNILENDFVYLDPPYAPENEKSFVGYTADGFSLETHEKLFDLIKNLKCKFVMSNAKVKLVTDSFIKCKTSQEFNCEEIVARRAINSKKPESITIEVIISN